MSGGGGRVGHEEEGKGGPAGDLGWLRCVRCLRGSVWCRVVGPPEE